MRQSGKSLAATFAMAKNIRGETVSPIFGDQPSRPAIPARVSTESFWEAVVRRPNTEMDKMDRANKRQRRGR